MNLNRRGVVHAATVGAAVKASETNNCLRVAHDFPPDGVWYVKPDRLGAVAVAVATGLTAPSGVAQDLAPEPPKGFHRPCSKDNLQTTEGGELGDLRTCTRGDEHLPLVPELLEVSEQSPGCDFDAPRRKALR